MDGFRKEEKGLKGKKIIAMLFFLLLICLPACGREESGKQEQETIPITETADEFLVKIEAEGVWGSGVVYTLNEEELIVLTAGHVVCDAKRTVTIYFADGSAVDCDDILCSEIADLARLKLSSSSDLKRVFKACSAVERDKVSFDEIQEGDECVIRGYSDGKEICKEGSILNAWIFVEDYQQYMIWGQGEMMPGMSGGGLLDEEGRLLGILSGGSSDGELVAVPLSLILQFEQSGW